MAEYQKYINALRKCANEHENDRTSTGHIIVSDLCRDTANLLEELEQEPILDKIRAEIEQDIAEANNLLKDGHDERVFGCICGYEEVLKIIDKYKAESEE